MQASTLLNYFRGPHFAGDAWGGLAAMLVALPSAIAFGVTIFAPLGGSLAAQGAMAGILGATALGLVAPAFGGTQRLITAPCAPAAAVLAALAVTYMQQGVAADGFLVMIGLIGLLAGLIQVALGFAGIGQLIKYIPYPVVSGYLSGVGLIIIGSQVPKLLGTPGGTGFLQALTSPTLWSWQAITVGTTVIALMLYVPRLTRAVPAAILALLGGVLAYLLLGLFDPTLMNVTGNPLLVGTLAADDGGLLHAIKEHWEAFSKLGFKAVVAVIVPALTLAVLLSIDTLKTCVVIDAMTRTRHDSNRELIGQGLGNVASAAIGGIPGAGTMGATLVNLSSGASTRWSGMMEGGLSLLAFLVLAPLIAWVPVAALASILIVIGFRMIDRHSLTFFYSSATRLDFFVIAAVILVALFVNLIAASGAGVALAILLFIREQTKSSVVRHRIEGSEMMARRHHSAEDHERLEREASDIVLFELQGSLFFGTANQLLNALEPEIGKHKYVILSMRRVQSLDVTATHLLEQIKDRLEECNGYLLFCDIPKGLPSGLKMKRYLKETGVVLPTNKAFAFRQLDETLEWIDANEHAEANAHNTEIRRMDLQSLPFLVGCSRESVAALAEAVELHKIKAGKRIFKSGTECNELFFIRSGTVRVMVPMRKKDNFHLATSGPGDMVGHMGFIESGKHLAEALAVTDCEVYMLTRERFEMLSVMHEDLLLAVFGNIARTLSSRLRAALTEVQALRG